MFKYSGIRFKLDEKQISDMKHQPLKFDGYCHYRFVLEVLLSDQYHFGDVRRFQRHTKNMSTM